MSLDARAASPAFNTAQHGTTDASWEAALEHEQQLDLPRGVVVLIVSPHPDDEVLGAGGLICHAARAGYEVILISVTDGEAAYPDWQGLDRIRRRELSDAVSVLSPHRVATHHLSIPDGRVDLHRGALFDAIDRFTTLSTLIVAPYERDGHPDHDATGEVCCEVARLRAAMLWRYPIWTWHHSAPGDFAGQPWGLFQLDAAALQAKVRALKCFTSQLRPLGREPIVPNHLMPYFTRRYESFLV